MFKFLLSKKVISCVLLVGLMAANYIAQTSGSGQSGAYTNAPNEGNCTSCHSGTALQTSGNNWNNLLLENGQGDNSYIPDSTYTMTVSYKEAGKSKFGFAVTALDSATNKPIAGTFTVSSTTQKSNYSVSGDTRTSLYHKSTSTSGNGAISWTFTWKAPSTNVGTIFFYTVVNSTNSSNSSSGDVIYAKKFEFRPSDSLPTAQIAASPNPVCEGDTLYAKGAGTMSPTSWKWSFANGSQNVTPSSSTNQDEKFVFSIGGNYKMYLECSNNKGTSLQDSLDVTVVPKPNISIAASGNTTLCQGDSSVLTASYSSGATILWNTGDTTDNITVTQSGSYTCNATSANGCIQTSNTLNISVIQKPSLTLSVSPQSSLCSTDTFNLTVSPSGLTNYYMIVNGSSVSNGSSNTYSIPYSGTAKYSITALADSNGCMSDTSNSLALTYSLKLSAPNVTCDTNTNSSITYKWQAITNATGYQVSEDSGATWITPSSGSTGLTHTVNGLANNTSLKLWVRATDNAPCNVGDAGSIVCSTGGCASIKYSTNNYKDSICSGDSSIIDITFTNSGTYSISLNGGTATSQTNYVFKPTQNTTYTFDMLDSSKLSCPATTFKLDIAVLTPPSNVSIQSNNANNIWCPGEAAKFTSTAVSGYTYEFFVNGTSVQKGSQNDYTSTTLQNGDKVKVTATNANGCSGTSSEITVTVASTLSNITIQSNSSNNTWCTGEAAKFTSTAVSGYTYEFFVNGTSVQKGSQNDYTSTTLQNGDKVKVTATNANGCSGTSSEITVTVASTLSNITIQSNSSNNTWCTGEAAKFTSSAVSGYTYEFFVNGASVQKGSQNDYTSSTLQSGDKVKVTATNANGCSGTSSEITVTIATSLSNVTIQSDNANNTWCQGAAAKFTSPSVSGYTYEFFVNGTSVQNGSQNDYTSTTLNTGEKVKVTATNAGGCKGTSSEITVTINAGPIAKPFKYINNALGVTFNFNDTVAANSSYAHTWNFGDGQKGAGTVVNHTYAQNGTYTVWMIIKNSNCADSISTQITVKNTGLSDMEVDGQLSIWPNPFTNEVNISWNSENKPVLMELNDIRGSKILSVSQSNIYNISSTTLATESLPSGIYWLKVVMQNGQTVKRIIKL